MNMRCALRRAAVLWLCAVALLPLGALPAADDPPRGFTLLPVIGSTPETGFLFGLTAMAWREPRQGTEGDRSLASGEAVYSTHNNFMTRLSWEGTLPGDRLAASSELELSRAPQSFFGIGEEAADSKEEQYLQEGGTFTAELTYRLLPDLHIGPSGTFALLGTGDLESGGLLDGGTVPGASGACISGIGTILSYDTRDNHLFPHRGSRAALRARAYSPLLGSEFRYQQLSADLCRYLSLGGGAVLALQHYLEWNRGEVPFQSMAVLGGQFNLRGFYQGRYRDKSVSYTQAELRLPLPWRFGCTLFGGAGQTAPSPLDFSASELQYAGGVGLRFSFSEEQTVNLRSDFAYSREGFTWYLGFLESF